MTAKQCKVDGCERQSRALGLCIMHYNRLKRKGDVGGAASLQTGILGTCTVEGCEKSVRSSNSPYCGMHYHRLYRTGQLTAGPWHRRSACALEGCDKPEAELGYCDMHATRVKRHGSPDICIAPEDRNLRFGPDNHSWTGDEGTYEAAHLRVRAARGSASGYPCVDCNEPARQWSYDHADPNERIGGRGGTKSYPYSLDPDHYLPRCVPCHKGLDLSIKRGAA